MNLKLFHFFFCHVSLLNVPGCELKETEYLEFKSFHRTMLDGTCLSSFRKSTLTTMKKHYRNTTNQETEKSIKTGCLSSRGDEHVTCHQTSFSPLSPGNKFQIRQYLICVCVGQIFVEQNIAFVIYIWDERYFYLKMMRSSQKLLLVGGGGDCLVL